MIKRNFVVVKSDEIFVFEFSMEDNNSQQQLESWIQALKEKETLIMEMYDKWDAYKYYHWFLKLKEPMGNEDKKELQKNIDRIPVKRLYSY
jgi:hypothetical protein